MKNIKRYTAQKLTILAGLALGLLLALALVGYHKIQGKEESTRWVQHTLEVIADLEEINTTIYMIANVQKFYIISEDRNYQRYFSDYLSQLQQLQMRIRKKVADNPQQLDKLSEADARISSLLSYYGKTIQLVDLGQKSESVKLVNSGRGGKLLEAVNAQINDMKKDEQKLLAARLLNDRNARDNANALTLIGAIGALVTLVAFMWIAYQENKVREEAQRELDRTSQVQRAILNAAAYAIIASEKDGKITHFNPAAEKLLGYSADEVRGQTSAIFHDPAEVARQAEALSARFGTRIPVGYDVFVYRADRGILESDHWTYIRKDGSRVKVALTVSALRDLEGKVTGYIGIANDITRQLEVESYLTQAREEALAGTRAKSEFLANMSHEIRTPLNAIMGMAELLNESPLNGEQRKYVEIFQSAGTSLLNIINDILDLSKIEAGHFELDESPMKLSQVISGSVDIVAVKAHQKGLELIVDQQIDMHDFYHADGPRLRQMLLNLLGNAVKFTKQGEVMLKISSGRDQADGRKEVVIEVLDSGIGMTEVQIAKLFQRFSQADSSITKEFGGTGLGLSITQKLVSMMDGTIEVQSTFGIGSRFKISIMLKPTEVLADSQEQVSINGLHFLIVDDNKTNRLILKKMLEHKGATTREAENGEVAWDVIQNDKKSFDMILLDGRMPKMDGFSLAEKILTTDHTKKALLMMLTSDTKPGDIARSKQLGVKSHLVKPILKNDLLLAIGRTLNGTLQETRPATEAQPKAVSHKQLSVLLVDDNDENRLVIKAFMKNMDVHIDEAKHGKEALNYFQNNAYDLILMDMQMPVMDGYSAVTEIRAQEIEFNKNYSPIVAISAFALKEEIQRSYEVGCNAHLTKPIAKKDLLAAIEQMTKPIIEEVGQDMADILPDYLNNRKIEVVKLSEALSKADFKTLQFVGHKLAGSAGSYGLLSLTEIGKRLEEFAREQDKVNVTLALTDYKTYLRHLQVTYTS